MQLLDFDFALTFNSGAFNDGPTLIFPTKDDHNLTYAFGPRDTTQWVHLVGSADATNHLKQLWIDGMMVGSIPFTGSANLGHHYKLQIGRIADGRQDHTYFKGKIDDLRFFNRALTAEQIESLRLELRFRPTMLVLDVGIVPGISVSFDTAAGKQYSLQGSLDLRTWDEKGKVTGDGSSVSVSLPMPNPEQVFRLRRN